MLSVCSQFTVTVLGQLRDHEERVLPGVAQQPRDIEMRRGLHSRFRLCGNADARIAFGQADDLLTLDDLFDVAQHSMVVVQHLVAVDRSVTLE